MKKLLILILFTLLLLLSVFIIIQGVSIGNFEILGIRSIQSKSNSLDEKIQQAAKLAEKDFGKAVSDVENSSKELKEQKKNYDDLVIINNESGEQVTNQIVKYEIESLWVKLGNHATSQGAVMQMDIVKSANAPEGVYDLKFTATGDYISITDFVSAIENDSTLGFKIEQFSMKPGGNNLQATFTCKDIAITDVDMTRLKNRDEENDDKNKNNNNKNNNNTNNTNSTDNNENNKSNNTNNSTANNTNNDKSNNT